MKRLFQEANQAELLYRLILDNALDAFIAIDADGAILEWSEHAIAIFGWERDEVFGKRVADTIMPARFRGAYLENLRRYREADSLPLANRRIEMVMCRKDGTEIPVELTVTPIKTPGRTVLFVSLRELSQSKALEEALQHQVNITSSILHSMAAAVVVADMQGCLIVVNPAGRELLHVQRHESGDMPSLDDFTLLLTDGVTACPEEQRPLRRALRGEHVDGFIARVRHAETPGGVWVSINARPLIDKHGELVGAVGVYHNITALRRHEEELAHQAHLMQAQASLLDLAHDAIIARTVGDVITYWNLSAEKLYGYSRAEALGQVSHALLRTCFPIPLDTIRAILHEQHRWEGELIQFVRDGREIVVYSKWALDFHDGKPYRYLETNADITQQVRTERALKQSQEDFRLLVEASTDHAILMIDCAGIIQSWNSGAERIIGFTAEQAIGRTVDELFTAEDRNAGESMREMEEARATGRAEDDRWHVRRDGSRFWATGVVTPLWNPDGSLRGYVKIMRDQTSQRLADEQTRFLAHHDALTGLPNRVNFSTRLHQSIALSQRHGRPLALLLLDLDRFKYVNDTFGHHTGDLLLQEVALRILSSIRESDFVARLGGDEFVVIQADVSQPEAAETLARKLVLELGRPYALEGQEVLSGTSVGLCVHPKDGRNPVELLKRADLALYRAKNRGRHTYQFYTDELVSEQSWRKDRATALRGALENRQFELYYQPQINLRDWKICSVEALLRWNASEMETVLPKDFLDIAEQIGLTVEIGEWALHRACRQVRHWQTRGFDELRLSVNCSARQFSDPGFVTRIPAILRDTGIAPRSLELEAPERMLAERPEIKEPLSQLRSLGIRVLIDNFGTGATALTDFKDFTIDALKIDKTFVQHLPHRREDSAITSAIINLAHNLGVSAVAGGVETAEQLAYLKARDCTSAQGFIFSPPLPARRLEEMMFKGGWLRINRAPLWNGGPSGELH
jgi:diguanylate cyclase (GGDEF)-like protein/PAS domain S-box-containing protein